MLWGADTIMDLSTGANIMETREWIMRNRCDNSVFFSEFSFYGGFLYNRCAHGFVCGRCDRVKGCLLLFAAAVGLVKFLWLSACACILLFPSRQPLPCSARELRRLPSRFVAFVSSQTIPQMRHANARVQIAV